MLAVLLRLLRQSHHRPEPGVAVALEQCQDDAEMLEHQVAVLRGKVAALQAVLRAREGNVARLSVLPGGRGCA